MGLLVTRVIRYVGYGLRELLVMMVTGCEGYLSWGLLVTRVICYGVTGYESS